MLFKNLVDVGYGLRSLIFPELCIVCERELEEICSECITPWNLSAGSFKIRDLRIISTVPYGNEVSSVVLKAKEDGLRVAQRLLAQALTKSILAWSNRVNLRDCVLVPIPSSKKAIRRRGRAFMHPILQISINQLQQSGFEGIEWKEVLKHTRSVLDQSQLNFEERAANLRNAFHLVKNGREIQAITNKQIILIDDVVTSGATLLSAQSAFIERKMTVLGAATACAAAHHLLIR